MEQKLYGIHWIASYSGCENKNKSGKYVINDFNYLQELLSKNLEDIGATILSKTGKQFEPQGVTVLISIAESHASAHTWPEDNFMEFDFNTCNLEIDGERLLTKIAQEIGAKKLYFSKILRYEKSNKLVEEKTIKYE
ncbi:MAG: adenosylmethionine decarboxylase [Nanoarchaeota archaeon]|nr:adenosylmethionine decarboxylase [Nanoarchaeota archaeon]